MTMTRLVLLLTTIWLLAAGQVTTPQPEPACRLSPVVGRHLHRHPAGDGAVVLANVGSMAPADCGHLCCNNSACRLAVFGNATCILLQCERESLCGLQLSVPGGRQQLIWRAIRQPTGATIQTSAGPAAAALLSTSPASTADVTGRPCLPNVSASCPPSQQCVPLPGAAGGGTCRCGDGRPPPADGVCGPRVTAAPTATPPPSPATTTLLPLLVTVQNRTITLPNDSVTLQADVQPPESPGHEYRYEWKLLSGGAGSLGDATINDAARPQVRLDGLAAGLYVFQLQVTAAHAHGVTFANVTVKPAPRVNRRPVAVVSPANQTLHLPNSKALLDGSASRDELPDSLKFDWEVVQAPLHYHQQLESTPTVQLKNLTPGNYTISLTVEDTDGASDSANAHVSVLKEPDYAPQANAGDDVVLYLPNSATTLNGTASKDDKGIVTYEWTKVPGGEDKAVDMQDTHTPYLRLSKMEKGVYTFQLKVTDSAEHTSTDRVVVMVKSQANTPPKAVAGKNQSLTLPRTWAVLDGSASHDDLRVTSWLWEQVSGPAGATILNATRPVANATGLTRGHYTFRLTVRDDASNSTALTNVTIVQATNLAPVADAGGDLTLHLPVSVVTLNGSRSSDDLGIVSWRWTRDGSSLAAGRVVADTDTACSLQLVDMVAGQYRFHLTVTDEQGATAQNTVSVVVQEDPNINNQLRLELEVPFSQWTEAQKAALARKVALSVPSSGDVEVSLLSWTAMPRSGNVLLNLMVSATTLGPDAQPRKQVLAGTTVAAALRTRLRSDPAALDHTVVRLETVVCQNDCSGHGRCVQATRACICDRFWAENVFRRYAGGEANCDWSVLYVIIISFSLVVSVGMAGWGAFCVVRRWLVRGGRARRPSRYAPLTDVEKTEMLPKNGHSASSVMTSETDSESEPLFEAGGRRRARNNNKRRKRSGTLRSHSNAKKM